jgi:hypothetical protein
VITFEDAEAHLVEIAREDADLRRDCNAIETQRALVDAYETPLTEASLMLHRHQALVAEIDRTDNRVAKQEIMESLVQWIRVHTESDRTLTVTIKYHFSPMHVAKTGTACDSYSPG